MRRFHTVCVLLAGIMMAAASPVHAQAPGMFTGDDDEFWYDPDPYFCVELTDRRIRQEVANQGFDHIFLNARNGRRVQVRATQGEWVYLLQVSTCTGSIIYGQRLRPA